MKRKIIQTAWVILFTMLMVVCARSPIGDRILAKACIFGSSKYGQCQLAK
jgi:hypothetical protein